VAARSWGGRPAVVPSLARCGNKGSTGGHKGPHTTPRRSRPYGMMIMLVKNLPYKRGKVTIFARVRCAHYTLL
jgi:hypothetical protein